MAFLENFLIPLIKVMFIIGILGYICFVVARFFQKFYNKTIRWFFRYRIMKKPIRQSDLTWILDALNRGFTREKVRTKLLVAGIEPDRVYEMVYLFDQIEQKGGENNVRQSQRRDKETEGAKLPSH